MENIDRKFRILAVNPVNGKIYTEADSLLLCAKDTAVPAALFAYKLECERIGANSEHIRSIELLYNRVKDYHSAIECRVPDTIGAEIPRCLAGDSPQPAPLPHQLRMIEERQMLDENRQKLTAFIMEPYQERVVVERRELNEKRKKLICYIQSPQFHSVNGAEKARLHRQAAIMSDYYDILTERINSFRPAPPGPPTVPVCRHDKHVA